MSKISYQASLPAAASPARRFGPNHRWVVLGVGAAAQASFSVAFSGLPAIGILMRADYGLSTGQLGFVLGCMALGVGISEIIWGLLTDHFGDRRILLLGLSSMGAMLALMAAWVTPFGVAPASFYQLGGSLILVGLLGGSVNSSSGRAIMTWFTDGRRGFAMSLRQTAIPAGGAIGAALLPWLAKSYGYGVVYGVLAMFCFASALAAWLWLHEAELPHGMTQTTQQTGASPLRRVDVWRLALASGLLTVPQIAVLTFAGVYLHDVRDMGLGTTSLILIVAQVIGGGLRIWSGRYTDRHNNRRSIIRAIGMAAGLAALAVSLLSTAPVGLVIALLCLTGLLANAWHGVAFTEIATMAGASRAGTAIGMEGTTIFASAFVTPLLIPVLLAVSSWPLVWAAIALAALIAVPLAPGKVRH